MRRESWREVEKEWGRDKTKPNRKERDLEQTEEDKRIPKKKKREREREREGGGGLLFRMSVEEKD